MASPKRRVVDIKSGPLFAFQFLVLGGVFLLAGIIAAGPYLLVGAALVLIGTVILTAHEGTEISPDARVYREYNSFLFIKTGAGKKYDRIEKIFVNPGRVTRRYYTAHTSSSSTFTDMEYNGYVKFSDGVKVFLLSGRNRDKVITRLKGVADSLNIPFQDNTLVNQQRH